MYPIFQNLAKASREYLYLSGESFDLSYSDLSQGQSNERTGSTAWSRPPENQCEQHTPGSGDSDSNSQPIGSEARSPADTALA